MPIVKEGVEFLARDVVVEQRVVTLAAGGQEGRALGREERLQAMLGGQISSGGVGRMVKEVAAASDGHGRRVGVGNSQPGG